MLLLLLACTGTTKDTGETSEAPFEGSFALTDANNYAYTSALSAGYLEVGLAADFTADWSALDADLLGHTVDPAADVDNVWLVQFPNHTEDELLQLLTEDSLLQLDIGAVAQFKNTEEATSANLATFVFPPAAAINPETDFVDGSGTWLLRATTGLVTTRMFTFVRPTETSTNHALSLSSDSATLAFSADLASLNDFSFAGSFAPYTVDWSGLEHHANGNEIELDRLDQLTLARYDGKTVADLEDQFLDIELIANETYTADVYGMTSVDLSALVSTGGAAFTDFTPDSLWLMVLRCTACTNPAPPFVTVIQVGS
jgi:hypothetical protein